MKIRRNFVSNSSSTSFVCVVTETAHKKALREATPEDGARLAEIFGGTKIRKFGNRNVRVFDGAGCDDYQRIGKATNEGLREQVDGWTNNKWEQIEQLWQEYEDAFKRYRDRVGEDNIVFEEDYR